MNDSEATEPIQDLDDDGVRDNDAARSSSSAKGSDDAPLCDAGLVSDDSPTSESPSSVSPEPAEIVPEDISEKKGTTSIRATAEPSGRYTHPDGGPASSQRARLIPPGGVKTPWWFRYRRELTLAELILTGLFLLLTLYFLVMWIFAKPAIACIPQASWRVPAVAGRWRTIVLHHTATERSSPESIDRFHRDVRKWEGLGYHFLIGNGRSNGRDPTLGDGEVHVGVRWREQRDGAHVRMKEFKNANSFAVGIALIGNFENEEPTPRQVAALCCLVGFLVREYGISKTEIYGHGQVSAQHTLCPGRHFSLEDVFSRL